MHLFMHFKYELVILETKMWKSDETVLNYFQPFWQSAQQNTLYESIHLLTKCLDLFGYWTFQWCMNSWVSHSLIKNCVLYQL